MLINRRKRLVVIAILEPTPTVHVEGSNNSTNIQVRPRYYIRNDPHRRSQTHSSLSAHAAVQKSNTSPLPPVHAPKTSASPCAGGSCTQVPDAGSSGLILQPEAKIPEVVDGFAPQIVHSRSQYSLLEGGMGLGLCGPSERRGLRVGDVLCREVER
jgi:hypothetical protein